MLATKKILQVIALGTAILGFSYEINAVPIDALPDDYEHNQKIIQLYNRLDRLDKEFIQLQQYLSSHPTTAASSETGNSASANPMRFARMEARMGEIEEKLRQLNGKVEELAYNTSRLLDIIDQAKDARTEASLTPQYPLEKTSSTATADSQVLGKIDNQILETNTKQVNASIAASANIKHDNTEEAMQIEEKDAAKEADAKIRADYQNAFSLVRQSKFAQAEKALQDFIKDNPKHSLTGNAYYWLGEVFYVQKKYEKSAAKFLRGYRDFPQGKWAAESLYKVALSLVPLKKTTEACSTLRRLEKEFPAIKEPLKTHVKDQKSTLRCQ